MFQFTHPCGCDDNMPFMSRPGTGFNSRTRVGATHRLKNPVENQGFQFTHPCGCDLTATGLYLRETVSIHAPVWVRRGVLNCTVTAVQFQFTHPCGCDCIEMGLPRYDEVSIHAPVWVRRYRGFLEIVEERFQFTHPCGCDFFASSSCLTSCCFNSRTRVGATNHVKA